MDKLSEEPRKMLAILAEKLQEEEQLLIALTQLQGSMQMLLSSAETVPSSAVNENYSLEPSNAAQTNRDLVLSIV